KQYINRIIRGKQYIVYRPNHGLSHGIRQAFLIRDIIHFLTTHNTKFTSFLKKQNSKFITKLMLISAFQRSGRESEVSSSNNKLLYDKYERQDVNNCIRSLTSYIGILFTSKRELYNLASCILWNNTTIV